MTAASPAKLDLPQLIERTAWSAIESIAAVYIAKGTITISGTEIALLTALTAFLTAIKTFVLGRIDAQKSTVEEWLEDTVTRGAFTFGETLLAALITAAVTPLNMGALKSAVIAAAAAALAAVKAAVAKSVGNPDNAATLPAAPPTTAPPTTAPAPA